MVRTGTFVATVVDKTESTKLILRWRRGKSKMLAARIRTALASGNEIPDDTPRVNVVFNDKTFEFLDLRGLDLSGVKVGDVDLTYCCFDYANFSNTTFAGTHLQYSTFREASFEGARWDEVQASPISGQDASFRIAKIRRSFLMMSDLARARFDRTELVETALAGSNLDSANLEAVRKLNKVDVAQVLIQKSPKLEKVFLHGAVGTPAWIAPSSPTVRQNGPAGGPTPAWMKKLVQQDRFGLGELAGTMKRGGGLRSSPRPAFATMIASLGARTMRGTQSRQKNVRRTPTGTKSTLLNASYSALKAKRLKGGARPSQGTLSSKRVSKRRIGRR